MFHRQAVRLVLGILLFNASAAFVFGQISIDNITADRSTYTDRTWFRVNSAPGYEYSAWLDGNPIPTDVAITNSTMDYHEIFVRRVQNGTGTESTLRRRFIIMSSNRGSPENGLMEWTPYPLINSTADEWAGARLHVIAPESYPENLPIPVVAWVDDAQGRVRRGNGVVKVYAHVNQDFKILRGHGSTVLPAKTDNDSFELFAQMKNLQTNKTVNTDPVTTWTAVSGVLSGVTTWPENSRIHLNGHVGVPAGSTLTIGAGTIVKLERFVTITNRGTILIQGTTERPVVFTALGPVSPDNNTYAWGGFIIRDATARFVANGTIFNGGGGGVNFDSELGDSHKSHQAVFIASGSAQVSLTNCAVINIAGQLGNGTSAYLTFDHCLVQKAVTGGEYVGATQIFKNSAIIEFPEHNGVVNRTIADYDYDGLYFTTGTHIIADSLVGFAMDDALDSGSGQAGTIIVTNSWIEAALHEANAWSGGGRVAHSFDNVLIGCGQGLECGWSDGANSPLCYGGNLLSINNSVGTRYGDNYDWTYNGYLRLTNSLILNNHRDIWGVVWDSTWSYRAASMDVRENLVTTINTNHPNNGLWNPATDGWRLAPFMTTPANAPVGIGLALWTNQFAVSALANGVPVGLSSFTTNPVSVGYTITDDTDTPLADGTITVVPGEVIKRIYATELVAQNYTTLKVFLRDPVNGQLTGTTNATYVGTVPLPQVMLAGTTAPVTQGTRLTDGAFLYLNTTPVGRISVDYTYSTNGIVLESGTFVFDPPANTHSLMPTGINPFDYRLIDLSLSNPVGASLVGVTTASFTNQSLSMAFGTTSDQMPLDSLTAGLPIRLSAPAPSGVTVDFRIEGAMGVLTNGTVAFPIGQTTVNLTAPTVNLAVEDLLRVTLSNPVKVPFDGITALYLVRTVPPLPPPPNVTLIARGARWRYRDAASAAPAGWNTLSFDHSAWLEGPAQLGFNEGDESTLIADNNQMTSYFRHVFTVTDGAAFTNLSLWLLRDDGGVVYVNGNEVFRSPNLPAYPALISYSTATLSGQNGDNTIDNATVTATNLLTGTNVVAVEMHQADPGSSDVSFNLELIGLSRAPSAPQDVYCGRFPDQVVFAWSDSGYYLEEAPTLDGPWTTAAQASPLVISSAPDQRFYRLHRR